MPATPDDDQELDPKVVLRFGMSRAEIEEVKQKAKEAKRRKNKTHRPLIH